MKTVVSLSHLGTSYAEQSILTDISFQIEEGEIVALVGKSGSGKSTLLHVLAGLKVDFSGVMVINEKPGLVFQEYAIYPWLTVEKNILFGSTAKERVTEFLTLAGLEDYRYYYPQELSGGQRQRLALAMVLAHDAGLLLMDEPYGALDAETKSKMHQWLLSIQARSNKTILFVTHDTEEALFLADRVFILSKGRISAEVTVPFARPRFEELKFSPQFGRMRKQLVARLGEEWRE